MKYEYRNCRVFYPPESPTAKTVDFYDVKIALGSWDEIEDAEDESIFYYMDGEPLEVGMIVGEGFVIASIDEDEYTCPKFEPAQEEV
jgi:hypothetical protein